MHWSRIATSASSFLKAAALQPHFVSLCLLADEVTKATPNTPSGSPQQDTHTDTSVHHGSARPPLTELTQNNKAFGNKNIHQMTGGWHHRNIDSSTATASHSHLCAVVWLHVFDPGDNSQILLVTLATAISCYLFRNTKNKNANCYISVCSKYWNILNISVYRWSLCMFLLP